MLTRKNGKPLTRRRVEQITRRWAEPAGVTQCLAHRFRHTFGTEMLRGVKTSA